jgi:selenocysteine-specific elongation factor
VKRLVLGVIGHVDHGKSALVRALTGADTDRLVEEKQRGISIALGFAHLNIGADTQIDLIDMPGHERFVRTMISGATGIDAVLLVLAANEGIKPQTIEHVEIAALLGLRRAVIAISKIDLVTAEQAQRVADQALQLVMRAGLTPLASVMTSALREQGIESLRQALRSLAAQPRAADGLVFLPIDRAFSIAGHGPVVTGTLRGAAVSVGDTLQLLPQRLAVRVRTVHVHGVSVPSAMPGQRVALNLRDVDTAQLKRGMALAAPDTLVPSDWVTISIRALEASPPLKNGMRLRAMAGTGEYDIRLRLLDHDVLHAGQHGFAQLHCAEEVALPAGEHVVLRLASPARTVAGGRVLEPDTRRQRRNTAAILQRLEDLCSLPVAQMIAAEVQRAGMRGTTLQQLSQLSALAMARIVELLQPLPFVVTSSGWVVPQADLDDLLLRIPSLLATPAGLSHDKLRSALAATASVSAPILDEALARLIARGVIAKRGSQLLIPRPEADQARARGEAQLASQIAEVLRLGGLSPPDPSAVVTDLSAKRAVDRLLRDGVLVRARDRPKGKEMLFHRDAIKDAQRQLAPLLGRAPGLLVTEIGAALGISRKYSIPLLEHLDSIRFTRRINDRRIKGAI